MNRIAYMVLKSIPRIPNWYYHIVKMANHREQFTEEESYGYLRNIVRTVDKAGRVDILVTGTENLPEKNGFIFFPNHQGLFDMMAMVDACPRPLSVVIKKEAENWILIKHIIRMLDGIYMDRSDIKASLEVINTMSEKVKQGRNFVIFAEGTRSKDGNKLQEFKAGTFKSALKANCPIVPVALIDCYRPFDISSIRRERVQVHFLKPIYPEQYIGLKTREIAHLVQEKIQAKIVENIGENK